MIRKKSRKLMACLVSLAMVISLFAGITMTAGASPTPTTISIPTDMSWGDFVDEVNNGNNFAGVTIDLEPNTDVGQMQLPIGYQSATFAYSTTGSPIVTGGTGFAGTLNGNGNTIDLFQLNYYDAMGLFSYLEPTGVINNLTLTGSMIERGGGSTFVVGGLVGYNCGIIDNVTSEVEINVYEYTDFVGGIVGFNDNYYVPGAIGVIRNSQNNGDVSGLTRVGGIAGQNAGLIASCFNTGEIYSSSNVKSGVGGIAGRNGNTGTAVENGRIRNCYNTGPVSAPDGSWVGGITGFQNSLSSCANTYNVGMLDGHAYVANTAGENQNLTSGVVNCYAPSDIDLGADNVDGTDIETYTSAQMKDPSFVTALNAGQSPVRWASDTSSVNDGYPVLLPGDTSTTTPAAGAGPGNTVYLNGTASSNGNGSISSPFNNIADAVTAAGVGGVVMVSGTVTFNAAVTRNDSANFERAPGFSGTMFVIDPGAGNFVTLTSASIDGGGIGVIFDVVSGRLRLRGNIQLGNAYIGVQVESAGTLEVNRTIIDDCTYSVYMVSSSSEFIYNNFGGTEIESPVYLADGAVITLETALTSEITIVTSPAPTTSGLIVAEAATSTIASNSVEYFQYSGGGVDFAEDGADIYAISQTK